ncbi:AT-hook motif nuclear-localized protein 7-like [Salvia splendens]|uniref:AT-hook motif nuclear-localized protein 7-like n=1 Tax=Salvia splendens TaxID=180675 RepID=UPI001C26F326|nr:AT-hook motif nuclear-localized protein 7-like [Salvia splendens]
MEVDRESADSGSLSGNPGFDSPPLSGGDYAAHGGVGGPGAGGGGMVSEVVVSMEKSAAAVEMGVVVIDGGGNSDLATVKKKRGRPRKYDADGNLNPAYIKSPTVMQAAAGFTISTPRSYDNSSASKKGRGKHSATGNWQIYASLGELFANTAGGDFTPHVVTAHTGEDVAGKILTFAQKGDRGVCVLSANGSVSNVTLRQPGMSGGLLTYEGRFEILTLRGSYTVSDNGGMKSRSGGLTVSLASPDGRVIGGGIAGLLMAASPIQIVVGSFVPNGFKMQKQKQQCEPRVAPSVQFPLSTTVTAATPISQAPPQTNVFPNPAPQYLGEPDNSFCNKEHPNSASTDNNTADWNGSDHRVLYPDINISVSVEEH